MRGETGAQWRTRLGGAFATGAADYERLRPGYPAELVAWLLEPVADIPGPVADVGAGTGKLTAALVAAGRDVIAIEPSADMRARLGETCPGVDARDGTGEATGLPDASAAAVVYGQAWHWIDPEAGSAEAARVLRPDGLLGMAWNSMDLDDPRVAAVNEAMHHFEPGWHENDDSADGVRAPLVPDVRWEVAWSWGMTTADLAALVTTRSYYLARDEADRAHLRRLVGDAVVEHFGPVGDLWIELPQRSVGRRFRRP